MSNESHATFYDPEVKKRSVRVLGLHKEWYYGQAINVIESGEFGVVIYIPWVHAGELPEDKW